MVRGGCVCGAGGAGAGDSCPKWGQRLHGETEVSGKPTTT